MFCAVRPHSFAIWMLYYGRLLRRAYSIRMSPAALAFRINFLLGTL